MSDVTNFQGYGLKFTHLRGTDTLPWGHLVVQDMQHLMRRILNKYDGEKDDHKARYDFIIRELQLTYWHIISPLFKRRTRRAINKEGDQYCSLKDFEEEKILKKVIDNNGRVLATTPIGLIYDKFFC
tara:strand:+ start:484 stop:864 length:381 start_codon:yes stop_codon:yes gene_type:complete